MIASITLENFKCFKEATEFPFAKINLLTGINGRGKSTVLQSMLLMKQSVERDKYTNKIYFEGEAAQIGLYEDCRSFYKSNEDSIFISFKFSNSINIKYELQQAIDNKQIALVSTIVLSLPIQKYQHDYIQYWAFLTGFNDYNIHYVLIDENTRSREVSKGAMTQLFIQQDIEKLLIKPTQMIVSNNDTEIYKETLSIAKKFSENKIYDYIQYVAADRIGPQLDYKKKIVNEKALIQPNGGNAASLISIKKGDNVFSNLIKDNSKDSTVLVQISAWLTYIFDTNVELVIAYENETAIFLKFSINNILCLPVNVGFGYSYVLPILVAGLTATNKHTLIIENPEAHLHPKAQARLVEFLARVASCDVQIFIESHSEHILNAICIAVKLDEVPLKNDEVSVLYFEDTPEGEPTCTQIPILENGNIEEWRDGFFDQTNKDYKILYGF